jgi:prolyl-tRNA synthetase
LGLQFRAVLADSGNIGGHTSHEFHVLANSGEDLIAFSDASEYAANLEKAEALASPPPTEVALSANQLEEVATPGKRTIQEICDFFRVTAAKTLKTLIVKGNDTPWVALLLRGDHELNEIKLGKLPQIATPLTFIHESEIPKIAGCNAGFCGPRGLEIPIIADRETLALQDFICGANKNDTHLINVNWQRDLPIPKTIADIRNVVEGDPSPDGLGKLRFARGIEVGHVFQLGDKYSRAMKATVLNAAGKSTPLIMGCYGIGVSRTVAAAIEQNHDERGIIWPEPLAPFQIALIPISMHQSYRVREAAEKIYEKLQLAGYDVIMDDRKERVGVIFADMDLIGIPHRIVISEGNLDKGVVEYKARKSVESTTIPLEKLLVEINSICKPNTTGG